MTTQSSSIWWLHPAAVFGLASVGISLAAYAIPESLYGSYWRTPKFFDLEHMAIAFGCAAVFTVGAALGSSLAGRRQAWSPSEGAGDKLPEGLLRKLFRVSFWLCVAGYSLWIGLAIQRGMTLDVVLGILSGEKGAMYDARFTYLPTVGGVTTLTQFGTAAVVLGGILGCRFGWRRVLPKMLVVVAMALGRVVLNSERFALLEIALPLMVVVLGLWYLDSGRKLPIVRSIVQIAPLLGVFGLFTLFTTFEYFRSWSNYYAGRERGLLEFGALRLLGYYVTAFNNGAYLLDNLQTLYAPYFTLHCLWRFPLTAPFFGRIFTDQIFDTPDKWLYFSVLDFGGNIEFNNGGGIFFPLMDFGVPGGLIYWLLAGVACGLLFRLYLRKNVAGLLLYPIVYLGLLEIPLALYWGEGRAFPSICMLLVSTAVILLAQKRERFQENSASAARKLEQTIWAQSH